ncbi:MAG: hypothetical protein KF777_05895 [Planctomycetaceae bacterium]|nr:hypothetical protein [Planctomycetaceae bacterium]
MRPPKRTYQTRLFDPELLILDFLFDKGGANFTMLSSGELCYSFHMNCSYDHGLSDEELRSTISRLLARGMISETYFPREGYSGYYLTREGGRIWETERAPNWDRYCSEGVRFTDHGQEALQIYCKDEQLGRHFANVASSCRQYMIDIDQLDLFATDLKSFHHIYWRDFDKICCLEAPILADSFNMDTDWDYYEARRTWWRTLVELIKPGNQSDC